MSNSPNSPSEAIKEKSRGLRGTLDDSLQNNVTGALQPDDQGLIKFHGIYQQDDRDRREERERKKLERAYSYMVRLRLPGGDITPAQWLGITRITDVMGTGVVKITTRQTVQIHGVVKAVLKPTIQMFNQLGIDTIATCGDINRNVIAGANPAMSKFHTEVHAFAAAISQHLMPKSKGYAEVWLDGEKLSGEEPEEDPLYQKRYLPRKFKIAIAVPPHNDADVFANDVGLIAIEENGEFTGFNVAVGGGMGMTHGNPETYARLGTEIGFVPKDKALDTCWQIAAVQRDFGNRSDRARARLKYTVDRMSVSVFVAELEKRLGFGFAAVKPYAFKARGDFYAWQKDFSGAWFISLFVENGRVVDSDNYRLKTALRAIAETGRCQLRFTANQNIMLVGVAEKDKAALEKILTENGIDAGKFSPIRRDAMACVALNTCPLALAEGQRYMPSLLTKIEGLLAKNKLAEEPISIRLTGCPNGCARPHVAEIGLVGKSLGHYNLHLAGDRLGLRLNRVYRENIDEAQILATLDGLFARYAKERKKDETFGDYAQRAVKFGGRRMSKLTPHLRYLEDESVTIIREAVAAASKPVMLYSIGKDSSVMLHTLMKAYYPAKPPVELLHIDTRWKFREMIAFRDTTAKRLGLKLTVYINPRGEAENIGPFSHGSRAHTQIMKTDALKQALDMFKYDFIFIGARRDEEKSRAKERIFSLRNRFHAWDPKNQRPEFGLLFNTRLPQFHSMRVAPLSNWTEYDVWDYIAREEIPVVPLYFAAERPIVKRDGALLMVDDNRFVFEDGEKAEKMRVRFRTLGCYPLTGAIESDADTLPAILKELEDQRQSERMGRLIDQDQSASMERKKKQGYF